MKDQVRCANCNGFLGSPWLPIYVDGKGLCKSCSKKTVDAGGKLDRCSKCGDLFTIGDWDWGRKNQPDTLGFFVPCDTCNKPQRLCEECWNNSDDCPECEERREQEQWCVLCDLPLVNLTPEEQQRHQDSHK
jgi:hypothetical protein